MNDLQILSLRLNHKDKPFIYDFKLLSNNRNTTFNILSLSKTVDSVDFQTMFNAGKLAIRLPFAWIKSFICAWSDVKPVERKFGIPQGSTVEPILLIVCIQDLTSTTWYNKMMLFRLNPQLE